MSVSTGNNFYLDRINVSSYPAAVSCLQSPGMNVSVVPNPTNSNAYVVVNPTGNNADVHIIVSDVTGKTVFTANRTMTGTQQVIEVPATAIHQPGMYIVETISGSASTKNKLIVY